MDLQAENYEDLESFICDIESEVDTMNRNIKGARESIENAKHDLSLSSNGFVSALGNIIESERNPSSRVKTGLQYLNTMFGGGLERRKIIYGLWCSKRMEE